LEAVAANASDNIMAAKPRIKVPKSAAAGDIITIKTLISHKMESGQRTDKEGEVIPRQIINKFTCDFNGNTVFSCDMDPAVSANPYFEFKAKIEEAGTFTFTWVDDDGSVTEASKEIALA
jgi:sulfur-oxidizing protein SoxZ